MFIKTESGTYINTNNIVSIFVEGEVMCQIVAETVDRKWYVLTDNIKSVDEANAELKAIIAKIQIWTDGDM